MNNLHLIYKNLFFALLILINLTSCGLKYTPAETPESIEEERRFSLQEQLYKDFAGIGKKYIPLTYSELVVVKPDSYKTLDSLYTVKYRYRNELRPDLDRLIDVQQAIIENDTIPVLYIETHWFELIQDTTCEFIISEISMKKNNQITNVKNLDYFQTSKRYAPYAEFFMKEEILLDPEIGLTDAELSFYTFYKTHSAALNGNEKDAFMEHTFRLMQIAQTAGTLSTDALLKKITLAKIQRTQPTLDPSTLTMKTEEIVEGTGSKAVFQFYQVIVKMIGSDKPPMLYNYTAYLEPIQ